MGEGKEGKERGEGGKQMERKCIEEIDLHHSG